MADESTTQEGLGAALEGSPEGSDQNSNESPDGPENGSQPSQDGTSSDESSTPDESSNESGDDSQEDLPDEIKNAPPEIREELTNRWKGLQAKHTKKRQAEVEEQSTLREQMQQFETDAKAFRALQESPQFQALMGQTKESNEKPLFDVPEDATPETKAFYSDLEQKIKVAMDRHNQNVDQRVQEAVRPLYQSEAQRMVNEFFSKNPEAAQYRSKMAELSRENPKLTLSRLYYLAAAEDGKTASKDTPKPDTSSPEGPGKSDDDAQAFEEIAKAGKGDPLLRA